MPVIPPETLQTIQQQFHALIRERAAWLLDDVQVRLPELSSLLNSKQPTAWFPIPGFYGGFRYWFEGSGESARLITTSECRISGGSGRRHEITAEGITLIERF
jgi:hypothetical protein